jgi:3-carboxy-cis,cis-muconate cycloisomerase
MRDNIERTNGVIFAERAMMLLGAKLGRDVAHTLLETATKKSVVEGRHLAAVLAEMPEVTAHLDAAELERLEIPEEYLGSAEAFRKALIVQSGNLESGHLESGHPESDRRNVGTDKEK